MSRTHPGTHLGIHSRANTALTLSACGLAMTLGALLAQPTHREALADAVFGPDDVSMLTLTNGLGGAENPHETLYIIDSRSETLMVYFIENSGQKRLDFRQAVSLPELFRQARN
ncbi:MAG: hypothetical protein O2819_00265 [Planctomycetota bacterium]|nr:hypothetical protein [Planctomycetota bacterium]MDA1105380.1 hypothetical protein [Planctomycetota bacterium]